MSSLVSRLLFSVMAGMLFLVSGCLKVSEIVSTEFPQALQHEPSYITIKEYLRSLKLYEGFETRAQFDMLWMSDDMLYLRRTPFCKNWTQSR